MDSFGHAPEINDDAQVKLSPANKPVTSQLSQRIGQTARKNMREMFDGSDNPQELKDALITVALDDPKLTFAMLRFGWEKALAIRRERAVSVGFVGALIFSVTLQMVVAPLEPSDAAREADDWWSNSRGAFGDLYHIMITLGACLSAVSVVNSVLYMLWIQIYVSDADDFIWFCRKYSVVLWVDAPVVSALFFSVLAVAFACVSIFAEPVASVCFFCVLGLILMSAMTFIFGTLPGEYRMKVNFEAMNGSYRGYIEEAAAAAGVVVDS
jgi:hypothetical protein